MLPTLDAGFIGDTDRYRREAQGQSTPADVPTADGNAALMTGGGGVKGGLLS